MPLFLAKQKTKETTTTKKTVLFL